MILRDLPFLPEAETFDASLNEALTIANGFVYPGDRAEGQLDLLRVLRAHPDLAAVLLDPAFPDEALSSGDRFREAYRAVLDQRVSEGWCGTCLRPPDEHHATWCPGSASDPR